MVLQTNVIVITIIIIINLKDGLPELLLLGLVLTEPLKNNLAEVGKVDEALPDHCGHDDEKDDDDH